MKTNYKIILSLAAFVSVAAFAEESKPAAPKGPSVFLLTQLSNDWDNKNIGQAIYVNMGFKVSDTLSITPELANTITYRSDGKNGTTLSHNYVRLTVSNTGLWSSGPWAFDMGYRYVLPTATSNQLQGNLGIFNVRPSLKYTSGAFSMVSKLIPVFYLQRNGYQMNTPSEAPKPGKPNPLFASVVQLLPGYDFSDRFSLSAEIDFTSTISGNASHGGGNKKRVAHTFYHYWEFDWAVKDVATFYVFTHFESSVGDSAKKFRIYGKDASYGVGLTKNF